MTSSVDPNLVAEAERFADEIAELLDLTIAGDPPISALARENRVVVAPFTGSGEKTDLPLLVSGEHRLDLRIEYLCTWDFAGHYLAIEKSEFALKMPLLREALIRFDYARDHSWLLPTFDCTRNRQRSAGFMPSPALRSPHAYSNCICLSGADGCVPPWRTSSTSQSTTWPWTLSRPPRRASR
jgi:hypothetical protein